MQARLWVGRILRRPLPKGMSLPRASTGMIFHGVFENRERSKIVGKMKTALIPRGPAGSRNFYSGAAWSVNNTIPEKYQKAAWLFLVWQASMTVQKKIFKKMFHLPQEWAEHKQTVGLSAEDLKHPLSEEYPFSGQYPRCPPPGRTDRAEPPRSNIHHSQFL